MEDVRIEHRYNASHFKLDNHYENVYQMLLITNGRIRYRVGNKTYETGRGGVIVLNTLEEHELEVLEYPYERYLIRVQPDFFQNEVKYPEVIAAFIKPFNVIAFRFIQSSKKLARIRRKTFHVTPLSFGIDCIKCQRCFS